MIAVAAGVALFRYKINDESDCSLCTGWIGVEKCLGFKTTHWARRVCCNDVFPANYFKVMERSAKNICFLTAFEILNIWSLFSSYESLKRFQIDSKFLTVMSMLIEQWKKQYTGAV